MGMMMYPALLCSVRSCLARSFFRLVDAHKNISNSVIFLWDGTPSQDSALCCTCSRRRMYAMRPCLGHRPVSKRACNVWECSSLESSSRNTSSHGALFIKVGKDAKTSPDMMLSLTRTGCQRDAFSVSSYSRLTENRMMN